MRAQGTRVSFLEGDKHKKKKSIRTPFIGFVEQLERCKYVVEQDYFLYYYCAFFFRRLSIYSINVHLYAFEEQLMRTAS